VFSYRSKRLDPSKRSVLKKSIRRAYIALEQLESRNLLSVFNPTQIRHAYGFDQISFINGQGQSVAGDGTGQTIAIVDAFNQPNIVTDLQKFDQTFGLAAPPSLQVVNQTGGSTLPANDVGWGEEISLDVEWAHAIAPQAKILLVEANSSSGDDLLTAVDYARNASGVVAVSMSWGGGEFSNESSYDFHFTTPSGHIGVTFLASSGDSGSPASWPAISPNILAVGGTSLTLDSNNNISKETGWSGSGGGISPYEAQPSYQVGVVTQSSKFRTNPDVSYNADPNTGVYVYDSYGAGGWLQIGGTSAGSPQWAGLIAIADQGRTLNGLPTLQSFNDTLTDLYKLSSSDFNDITSGSNGGYSAGPGYDLVTGLGSPFANKIVADLQGPVQAPSAPTNLAATAGNQQVSLTWTSSASATSYNIYRSLTSGGEGSTPYKTGVTTNSFTDTGLTNGTTYYYQVTAVNSGGESQKSSEVSAKPTAPASVPAAPTNLKATPSDKQVALTWSASTGATSYNVYRSLTAGGEGTTPFKTGITSTSYTDTGLTDGTTYYYQVTAVNSAGESQKSSEVSATPASPASYHINFSSSTTQVPAGYFNDTGKVYGLQSNGLTYGWNIDNSVNMRDRDSSSSPDELHDSLGHMQKSNNPNGSWQIAVPNGTYSVHIISGDPGYIDSVYQINANGVLVISGTPTVTKHWFENTVQVTVTNGLLQITNASGSSNNKIDSIDITFVHSIALPKGGGISASSLPNIRIAPKLQVRVLPADQAPGSGSTSSISPTQQIANQGLNNALIFADQPRDLVVSPDVGSSAITSNFPNSSSQPAVLTAPAVRGPASYLFGGDYQSAPSTPPTDSWDAPWFPEIYINPETGEVSILVVKDFEATRPIDALPNFLPGHGAFIQGADETSIELTELPVQASETFGEATGSSQVMGSLALGAFWLTVARANDEEKRKSLAIVQVD
jgi:hypothetical protein